MEVFNSAKYLEEITGLTNLHAQADDSEVCIQCVVCFWKFETFFRCFQMWALSENEED